MTGAADWVLYRNPDSVVRAFRTPMPYLFEVATGDAPHQRRARDVDSHTRAVYNRSVVGSASVTNCLLQNIHGTGHLVFFGNRPCTPISFNSSSTTQIELAVRKTQNQSIAER